MTEATLINKVWNYATIMKDAGLSYTDYVRQLTYLLFLKMDYERETLLGERKRHYRHDFPPRQERNYRAGQIKATDFPYQ
mgnify:CR=1 FL=1